METYIHYIKIRETDNAILDGFSSAFHREQNLEDYEIFRESGNRHFCQCWLCEYGFPKFKYDGSAIVERELTQAELDEIEEEQTRQEIIMENVELLALCDYVYNGNIRPALRNKLLAKFQALKGEVFE